MAINFNFLPKYILYSFSMSLCTFVFSTKTKIKEKEKMHKGTLQIKAICSILTVGRSVDITALLCLFFVINTTQYHIEKTNLGENSGETPSLRDNAVVRCPLLADRAYNEVKTGENIGLIIHGSFVNQWRGIRPVNRLEDLFWLQNGNKGPFTTWMGQLVIKKPALKQREKDFCGTTLLTPGRTTAC